MTNQIKQSSAIMILAALVVSLSAATASAQPYDHLKCFKAKDPGTFKEATLDLDDAQFGAMSGCVIKKKSKEFCIPVRKNVTSIEDGMVTPVASLDDHEFDRLCYKVKCPVKPPATTLNLTDQFGTRDFEKFKVEMICTPAAKTPQPALCPDTFTFISVAGTGATSSSTNIETGWTGVGHEQDQPEGYPLTLDTTCPVAGEPCGECTLDGIVSPLGRCRFDPTTSCDTIDGPDLDDCGGGQCDYYLLPPMHNNFSLNPVCIVESLASDVTGTVNNESGDSTVSFSRRWRLHLGIGQTQPCPVCNADPVSNDGIAGGTCSGGSQDGQPCDANGDDATWGATSLDCPPNPGSQITNTVASFDLTTGAVSLPFETNCDPPLPPPPAFVCACGMCSLDPTKPCANNADCDLGTEGTCTTNGGGQAAGRVPNGCSDLTCTDIGGGVGECQAGGITDDFNFCDGVLRASGNGYMNCSTNIDCRPFDTICPGNDCGNCTLTQTRPCFVDPIEATGVADPTDPLLVDVVCMPGGSNNAANAVLGLPGAQRNVRQYSLSRD